MNTENEWVGRFPLKSQRLNFVYNINSGVAISGANTRYNPFGVAYTVATANSEFIPPNTIMNSVIVGQGNIVSYLSVASANTLFTVTELGAPHANTGTSGVNATPALGGPLE